jgi:hypothetical protein
MKRDAEKAQITQLQRALHWVIRNHATTNYLGGQNMLNKAIT